MPIVNFMHLDGRCQSVQADSGVSIMLTARTNAVDGILGECGGFAACGTCHVYVAEEDLARLPAIADLEEQMLQSTAAERRHNSRLACQIAMAPSLDGITVGIPPLQN